MLKRREQVSVPLDAELQADLSAREAALVQAQIQLNVASEAVIAREAAVEARELAADTREADPDHPEYALEELSPRIFSFNSPHGACPTCHGLGTLLEFDESRVVVVDLAQRVPRL